jgi:hypothetical protein
MDIRSALKNLLFDLSEQTLKMLVRLSKDHEGGELRR